ncbi:hypothetical protein [Paenibacillus marchantiophytorum]|nr:hypothetical protein [Paenibacillus marchantiophytorum]
MPAQKRKKPQLIGKDKTKIIEGINSKRIKLLKAIENFKKK